MADYLMKIEGSDGQIYLYNDRISITRSGFWAIISHGIKAQKDIVFKNITSVDLQQAGFSQGSFTINSIGETNKKDSTIKFVRKNNENFLKLKEKIIEIINNTK